MSQARPRGVRWVSYSPGGGYGDAALGYVRALEAQGVPVTWTPLIWRAGGPQVPRHYEGPLAHLVGRAIETDTLVLHLPLNHCGPWLAESRERRRILVTTWETDVPPLDDLGELDPFDVLVVPSSFNRESIRAAGSPIEVHAVPHCTRRVDTSTPTRFDRIGGRFVFYTIGTWSTRKAMDATVSAFLDAFGGSDDVALVVKTGVGDAQAAARLRRDGRLDGQRRWQGAAWLSFARLLAGRRDVPEIHLMADELPAAEIDGLHARGDCFISLTRSEGWGLCIADAVAASNPAVVTGWGGQLDYLGPDYPLLVDFDLRPTSVDVPDHWFAVSDHLRWAVARHEHAVELMRWVAEHREEAGAIGALGERRLTEVASPGSVGRQLVEILRG